MTFSGNLTKYIRLDTDHNVFPTTILVHLYRDIIDLLSKTLFDYRGSCTMGELRLSTIKNWIIGTIVLGTIFCRMIVLIPILDQIDSLRASAFTK